MFHIFNYCWPSLLLEWKSEDIKSWYCMVLRVICAHKRHSVSQLMHLNCLLSCFLSKKTLTPPLVRKTKPKSKLKQNLMNSSRTHLFYILAIITCNSSTAETIRINMNIWKKSKVLILYHHISETWTSKRIVIWPFLCLLLYSQTWQEKGDCKTFTASKTIVTHNIINITIISVRELYIFKLMPLW